MSIQLMNQVWNMEHPKGAARLVLLSLADQANDDGVCWPGLARIAKRAGIDRRHAITVINWLEDCGYIKRTKRMLPEERRVGDMVNDTNMYLITPSKGVYKERTSAKKSLPSDSESLPLVNDDHYPSDSGSPKPPFNHHINQEEEEGQKKPKPVVDNGWIYRLYENALGPLTPLMVQELEDLENKYAREWIEEAFRGAAQARARSIRYVYKILDDWDKYGFKVDSRKAKKAEENSNIPSGDGWNYV